MKLILKKDNIYRNIEWSYSFAPTTYFYRLEDDTIEAYNFDKMINDTTALLVFSPPLLEEGKINGSN